MAILRKTIVHCHHDVRSVNHPQQLTLHAVTGNILGCTLSGKPRITTRGSYLVKFIQTNNSTFGKVLVLVRIDHQASEDRAHVVTDITTLREAGDIDNYGGQFQNLLKQQLNHEGLTASGWTKHQDILLGWQIVR